MNLSKSIARMIALGWHEYDQARENLARSQRIEHNKRMVDLYERLIIEGREDIRRLKGECKK